MQKTKQKRNKENARNRTKSRKANSNARGYLGQGKLDEDRERRGQDRRTTGCREESGDGVSEGNRAQEALAESVRRGSLGTTRPVYCMVLLEIGRAHV